MSMWRCRSASRLNNGLGQPSQRQGYTFDLNIQSDAYPYGGCDYVETYSLGLAMLVLSSLEVVPVRLMVTAPLEEDGDN